jgi:hypothetical protein
MTIGWDAIGVAQETIKTATKTNAMPFNMHFMSLLPSTLFASASIMAR